MKIAITGTNTGLGLEIKECLKKQHEIIEISRPIFDLSDLQTLENLDLSNVDVLINNAGHGLGGGNGLKGHQLVDCNSIINVNLLAPIMLTQRFIEQNTFGKIIFITSRSVEKDIGGDSVYSASKSGLSTFIKCMRDELKNTSFNLIEIRPGRINSEFTKNRRIFSDNFEFDTQRPYMSKKEVAEFIDYVIRTDIFQTITISRNV